jgi:hypothetical protein
MIDDSGVGVDDGWAASAAATCGRDRATTSASMMKRSAPIPPRISGALDRSRAPSAPDASGSDDGGASSTIARAAGSETSVGILDRS